MAAQEYFGGPPPVYPPVDQQQGYTGYSPPAQYYPSAPQPTPLLGPDGKPHPFAHYLQPQPQPQPVPQSGYLQSYPQPPPGNAVAPYNQRPPSPLPLGADGPQDRGLGSTLVGAAAGTMLSRKMGGGTLGTIAGAVGGAILANAASHKIKDSKKKKKKSKKHGHKKKNRGSSSDSGSDSDSSSGGVFRKRYALGYSTGGGDALWFRSRRRHSSSSSD
ncbi:hypothetical protein BDZ91DRAFT_279764 [Kalaharituber pfeilii]|nr:hypothetical protein BDZ91DRAFT_279764 [Kalaharituber pfeilii]